MNFSASEVRSAASPRAVAALRCAVYTRKSSEEGLDQAFNSLDAQREAGTDYIRSQKHTGWVALPDRYDDGGYSGGSTDRPGLQRLLDDITLGRVDVVVVYKVDRLSRSLADFARLMQLFDEKGVSFVSVTQQFNTTTSMGRLTLNMLLSFAQFEREVAGERIRDKIAATFRKGIFVTGQPPLGYRRPNADEPGASERTLLIVPDEAAIIRAIYSGYLELGSLVELARVINAAGHRTRRWTSATGRTTGGRPFTTSLLYRILTNPICLGKVTHTRRVAEGLPHANHGNGSSRSSFRTDIYDGRHAPIIDRAVWDQVQEQMNTAQREEQRRWTHTHLLKGKLRTFEGHAMSPGSTHRPVSKRDERRAGGQQDQRLVRYYVSQKAIKSGYASCPIKALNAAVIDDLVRAAVVSHLHSEMGVDLRILDAAERDRHIRGMIARVEIAPERVTIELSKAALAELKDSLAAERGADVRGAGNPLAAPSLSSKQLRSKRNVDARGPRAAAPRSTVPDCRFTPEIDERRDTIAIRIAVQIKRHDGRRLILSPEGRDLTLNGGSDRPPAPSAHIVSAIGLAYAWREELLNSGKTLRTLADERRIALTRVKLLLQLVNLSPAILKATLTGTLSPRITLKNLHAAARELDWSKQATILGID